MFAAGNHPDLEMISLALLPILVPKKRDSTKLPIDVFIGEKEHRNQEGLCHRIGLRPFLANRKVAVIDDADHFSIESANALLKTLEEPPPRSLIILIGTSPARQLPTIRSRSQIIRFAPLDQSTVERVLLDSGLVPDPAQAARAAELSEGSIERAVQLADPALSQFREQLLSTLRAPMLDSVALARSVQAFVDEAGKEASQRRDRLRNVIDFAIQHYRGLLHDPTTVDAEPIVQALDSSLEAIFQIDRNANLATAIQHWSEQLAAARAGKAARMQLSLA
jgi:DNA polymerase-3 subunit delta'